MRASNKWTTENANTTGMFNVCKTDHVQNGTVYSAIVEYKLCRR